MTFDGLFYNRDDKQGKICGMKTIREQAEELMRDAMGCDVGPPACERCEEGIQMYRAGYESGWRAALEAAKAKMAFRSCACHMDLKSLLEDLGDE